MKKTMKHLLTLVLVLLFAACAETVGAIDRQPAVPDRAAAVVQRYPDQDAAQLQPDDKEDTDEDDLPEEDEDPDEVPDDDTPREGDIEGGGNMFTLPQGDGSQDKNDLTLPEPGEKDPTEVPTTETGTVEPEEEKTAPTTDTDETAAQPQSKNDDSSSGDRGKTLLLVAAAAAVILILAILWVLRARRKPASPVQGTPGSDDAFTPQAPDLQSFFAQETPVVGKPDAPTTNAPQSEDVPETQAGMTLEPEATCAPLRVASVHNVGRRKNQEDSLGISSTSDAALCKSKGVLAVVADGMGGLQGGEDVSSTAVLRMLQEFSNSAPSASDTRELGVRLRSVVNSINKQLSETVGLKNGGSTLLAAIIHDRMLSWVCVGDSRMSLFRDGKLTDLNKRHTFAAELDEMVREKRISAQQAAVHPDRDKLTSYLGMGELKYVDRSERPMPLRTGDKIILMSDGIFNTLSDPEIERILSMPTAGIASQLENAVLQKNNPYQDNFTALVLEVTDH